MKNLFEVNFHFGKESDKFLREFENRRADYSIREVDGLPLDDLRILRQSLSREFCTFAEAEKAAV